MRVATILIAASLAGCYRGGDGPQEPDDPPTDWPGERCDACYGSAITLGVFTGLVTGLVIAAGPTRPGWEHRGWFWGCLALGATTLAVGAAHAALNRDDLSGTVMVPGIIGAAIGGPAIVTGVIGLANYEVAPAPMIVPGGGGVTISGRF